METTRKKIVVLTGAGISAESGIKTFRDSDGLWENHRVEDVASPSGWRKNPALVLQFYNQRRLQLKEVGPNAGHFALAKLEEKYDVHIITQNVDDLHERGGSTKIMHLHGELKKVRSVKNPDLITETDGEIHLGDVAEDGAQLRPHIVWFGEDVPLIYDAQYLAAQADIFMVIGTSMVVYPAAGLINYTRRGIPIYIIDPKRPPVSGRSDLIFVEKSGTEGVPEIVEQLLRGE